MSKDTRIVSTSDDNFLIEVTPEQLDELRKVYQYSDEEPYVELHFSPYWKNNKTEEAS